MKRFIRAQKQKILMIIIAFISIILFFNYFLYSASYGTNFMNSFTHSSSFNQKTVMVIVPHQDDEINVAGAMIKNLAVNECKVIIVFTTNGDYYNNGERRMNEAIDAAAVLGVPSENIIFLGYGDNWDTEYNHIYHAPSDAILRSSNGRNETYGLSDHNSFRMDVSSEQNTYTRDNYKRDVKDVILKYLPNYIFSVDFDLHVDHRATSLIFEEALNEILKSDIEFECTVFKGFAYNTAWEAVNDFYKLNMESTVIPSIDKLNYSRYELDIPNYDWENRVRFPVPTSMLSYTKRSNLIYKALSKHASQDAKSKTGRVANSDIVFWERRTDSLTYDASIEVSSGDSEYLNDFKLIDTKNICSKPVVFDNCVWTPSQGDQNKCIDISFENPKDISQISFYDNYSLEDNILSGTLIFSDGTEVHIGSLKINGSETRIEFPLKNDITSMRFRIDTFEGQSPGLCEIEVYEKNYSNKEIKFIKLTLEDAINTFIYRYTFQNEKEISLNVYMYPNNLTSNEYRMELIDDANGNAKLEGNTLTFKSNCLPKVAKVRVELVGNSEIYDEVEFISYSSLNINWIKVIQGYEKLQENIINVIQRIL